MALTNSIRERFEAANGMSLDDAGVLLLSDSLPESREGSVLERKTAFFGRGYVNFGTYVDPNKKDEKNLEILNGW